MPDAASTAHRMGLSWPKKGLHHDGTYFCSFDGKRKRGHFHLCNEHDDRRLFLRFDPKAPCATDKYYICSDCMKKLDDDFVKSYSHHNIADWVRSVWKQLRDGGGVLLLSSAAKTFAAHRKRFIYLHTITGR
jgi:hypothetical protein